MDKIIVMSDDEIEVFTNDITNISSVIDYTGGKALMIEALTIAKDRFENAGLAKRAETLAQIINALKVSKS